jgi:hypothetical protein
MSSRDARGRAALTLVLRSQRSARFRLAIVRIVAHHSAAIRATLRGHLPAATAPVGIRMRTDGSGRGGHERRMGHAGKLGQQNRTVKHELQKMQSNTKNMAEIDD